MRSTRSGITAARVLTATAASNVLAVIPAFLVGALAVLIGAELGFSAQRLGAAVSIYYGTSAVASTVGGQVSERFGANRALRWAAIVSGASCLLVALAVQTWLHLVGALAIAACANAVVQPAANLALTRTITPRRQGLAFGLKQSAGPVAVLLAGLAVPTLGLTIGWRWAFGLAIILATTTWLLAWEPDPPSVRTRRSERRAGDLSQATLVLLAAAVTLAVASASTLGAFFVSSAVSMGHDVGAAGLWLTVGGVSAVLMRILQGYRADRRDGGHLVSVTWMVLVGAVGCALLAVAESAWVLAPATVLAFGFGWGWPGLYQFAIVKLNPGAPGDATGTIMVGMFAGGMLGPVLFGFIVERSSYPVAWLTQVAVLLTGAALTLLIRRRVRREVLHNASPVPTATATSPQEEILA
jgi:predicted MFS family arabinose efflux permease